MTKEQVSVRGAAQTTTPSRVPLEPAVSLQLMPWSTDVLYALLRGDASTASALAGVGYTPYFVEHSWLMTVRVVQNEHDPVLPRHQWISPTRSHRAATPAHRTGRRSHLHTRPFTSIVTQLKRLAQPASDANAD
jgi:hypothetical protein